MVKSSSSEMLALNLLGTVDGPKVRGKMHDGCEWYSVYDSINIGCNKTMRDSYGNTTFFRLTEEGSEYRNEVLTSCKNLKFPGRGQKETPCMTIRGLQRLFLILGGKIAAEFRELVEGTFTRVMAGDRSLIEVINANAASEEPVQQTFRQALAQEPVAPVLDDFCLKRKREQEDRLFELEMAERTIKLEREQLLLEDDKLRVENGKLTLQERKLEHDSKLIQHVNTSMGAINALKDWANVDERTKLQAEDHIKNVLFNQVPTFADQETAPLNVSIVAKEMGFKCTDAQLQRIGREMAKQYRETYKCDPPKHKQYVNGNYIPVNSYTERDRPIMQRVIRAEMAAP